MAKSKVHVSVLDYSEMQSEIAKGRTHLLLGNGFSIACDDVFSYPSLYESAVAAGLSKRAQKVFERIGTNNFEAVMRLLDDGHWLSNTYGLISGDKSEMRKDLSIIKKALVSAVATSHLPHSGAIPDEKKKAAANFLSPYYNVFCTNYDLLVYWINMFASDPPQYQDGFRADGDNPKAETLVFSERLGDKEGLFYIHGALHLFVGGGGLRKHCWTRSGEKLTDLIKKGLNADRYPLFVSEGTWDKKLEQIRRNGYLSYCFDKLGRICGRVVVFGFSFGDNDTHIQHKLSDNGQITDLFVGLYGDPDSAANRKIQAAISDMEARRKKLMIVAPKVYKPLNVRFYNSASVRAWG